MTVIELHPRGAVREEESYSQFKDYTQLRYDNITPCDIDGFIDFGNKAFVFLELKYVNASLSGGQRLAYERLTDACAAAKKKSIAIVAHHDTPATDHIPVHNLNVSEIRFQGRWRAPKHPMTVSSLIEKFREWAGLT